MFQWMTQPSQWFGLLALTILQIVLGVDNIVLVTILSRGIAKEHRDFARKLGVFVAMISRIGLLAVIALLSKLDRPFANVYGHPISIQSLVLGFGGLFLVAKATKEMYVDIEQKHKLAQSRSTAHTFVRVMVQIFFLDIIFSLDQVITAVGLSKELTIQIVSIIISVIVMMYFVNILSRYLEKHPSMRILSLSFLVLIGVGLVGQSMGYEFPKGYIYFAMFYALTVEIFNIRRRSKQIQTTPKP